MAAAAEEGQRRTPLCGDGLMTAAPPPPSALATPLLFWVRMCRLWWPTPQRRNPVAMARLRWVVAATISVVPSVVVLMMAVVATAAATAATVAQAASAHWRIIGGSPLVAFTLSFCVGPQWYSEAVQRGLLSCNRVFGKRRSLLGILGSSSTYSASSLRSEGCPILAWSGSWRRGAANRPARTWGLEARILTRVWHFRLRPWRADPFELGRTCQGLPGWLLRRSRGRKNASSSDRDPNAVLRRTLSMPRPTSSTGLVLLRALGA